MQSCWFVCRQTEWASLPLSFRRKEEVLEPGCFFCVTLTANVRLVFSTIGEMRMPTYGQVRELMQGRGIAAEDPIGLERAATPAQSFNKAV